MSVFSISGLVAISVAIGFSLSSPVAAQAQEAHARVTTEAKSVAPVVVYARKFTRDMHDYTQAVVDGKADIQVALKSSVLADVQDIRTTLTGRGLVDADKLILMLNGFDGSVDHMKPIWEAISSLMSDVVAQYGRGVFHQIVSDDMDGKNNK